jgi:hypothetical protein
MTSIDNIYKHSLFKKVQSEKHIEGFFPYYDYRTNIIYFPSSFNSLNETEKKLIINYLSLKASDFCEIMVLSIFTLNQLIANFNFYCGSVFRNKSIGLKERVRNPYISCYSDDNEIDFLACIVEGLPIMNRAAKKNCSVEDIEMWKLQENILSNENTHDIYKYGFKIFLLLNEKFSGIYNDIWDLRFQGLIDAVAEEFFLNNIESRLKLFYDQAYGLIIPLIDLPSYQNIVNCLINVEADKIPKLMSESSTIKRREKILSVYKKVENLFNKYDKYIEYLKYTYNYKYNSESYTIINNFLKYLCKRQECLLNIFKRKTPEDVTAFRLFTSISAYRFQDSKNDGNPIYGRKDFGIPSYALVNCSTKSQVEILELEKNNSLDLQLSYLFIDRCKKYLLLSENNNSVFTRFPKKLICPLKCLFKSYNYIDRETICKENRILANNSKILTKDSCQIDKRLEIKNKPNCLFIRLMATISDDIQLKHGLKQSNYIYNDLKTRFIDKKI